MKKCIEVLAVLALAAGANAADVLTNGGFQNGDLTGWTQSGDAQAISIQNDRTGPDGVDIRVGSDWPGNYVTYLTQEIAMTPGTYDIHIEGWTKIWSGGWVGNPYEMEAYIELLVDGSVAWQSPNADWDAWSQQSTDIFGQVVNSSVGVRLQATAIDGNEPWAHARFDDIVLDVVPEPVTAFCLALGLPVVLLRPRRR